MKRRFSYLVLFLFIAVALGCNKASSLIGKAYMRTKDGKVLVKVPRGWALDDNQMCHKDDYKIGLILEGPIEEDFETMVDAVSSDFGTEIVSREYIQVDGYDAIKDLLRSTDGTYVLAVYINRGDKFTEVSFSAESENAYNSIKNDIDESISSIEIKD